jgi:hypothetical protein
VQALGYRKARLRSSDRSLCLEALDGLLKQLLWYGYSWPKTLSAFTTLSLTSNLASIALPTDYYTGGRVNYVDASGNEVPLYRFRSRRRNGA